MLNRISFLPSLSRYEVFTTFLEDLKKAFSEVENVQTFLFLLEGSPEECYQKFKDFDPQLLIAFNSLFAQPDGNLICDYLNVPMLYFLVDAPWQFDPTHSPLAWISCIDRGHCRYLIQRSFDRTLFLPHAIDKVNTLDPGQERKYDLVMLSSSINYSDFYEQLMSQLNGQCRRVVEEGLARWEENKLLTLDEALEADLPTYIPRGAILQHLDNYLKGLKRVEMLKALKDFRIDLFGGGDDWSQILGDSCPHVTLHPEVSFAEANHILSQSKVVLNSCASIRDGLHERILYGLSQGAAVYTESNPYLNEQFGEGKGIVYSTEGIAELLDDASNRCEAVERGRNIIAQNHLWRHRVKNILESM